MGLDPEDLDFNPSFILVNCIISDKLLDLPQFILRGVKIKKIHVKVF